MRRSPSLQQNVLKLVNLSFTFPETPRLVTPAMLEIMFGKEYLNCGVERIPLFSIEILQFYANILPHRFQASAWNTNGRHRFDALPGCIRRVACRLIVLPATSSH